MTDQQTANTTNDSAAPGTSAEVAAATEDVSSTNGATPIERYTLTTAICLIIGVCIGSGIFFKSDNILVATGGNIFLGVALFLIAATNIVFGGLTLARFAAKTSGHGGVIAYAREFLGKKRLAIVGCHFAFLYLPAVTAIVSWVVGVYTCLTFGLPNSFLLQVGIGSAFLILCTIWNIVWPVLSGYFQNLTTVAKVLPLIAVGVLGFLFANPADHLSTDLASVPGAGLGWLAGAAPIAFAFDGWSSTVSIAPEIRNAKRNLPIALIVGPLMVLVLYLLYFVGISCYLGPETVMSAGDASLSLMFTRIFGERAAALPNLIALIAVMGTGNGLILALTRMPHALAVYNEIPAAETIARIHPTFKFPVASALVVCVDSLIWMGIHVVVTELNLLPNGDVSEIPIGLGPLILSFFYIKALFVDSSHGLTRVRRAIAPIIAIASSIFIVVSANSDPTRWPFSIAYIALLACATLWSVRRKAVSRA